MADPEQSSPAMDMDQHARSFGIFMRWLKVALVSSSVVATVVVLIIAR